jgi:Uncharacterized protein conserved in bacteria (DUF2313).
MQTLILNHYPPVIQQIREIQQIANAEDIEFSKLNRAIDRVIKNMFIFTSDETGVARFEAILGIIPKKGQTLDDRKLYILLLQNRRKMSLQEMRKLLSENAGEIELIADYEKEEITVKVGKDVINIGMLFEMLNDIIPLHILIFFGMEIAVITEFKEMAKELVLETTAKWEKSPCKWYLDGSVKLDGSRLLNGAALEPPIITEIEMENTIETATDTFEDAELTAQKNLWYLDGSVKLDGSRLLNAEIYEEVI